MIAHMETIAWPDALSTAVPYGGWIEDWPRELSAGRAADSAQPPSFAVFLSPNLTVGANCVAIDWARQVTFAWTCRLPAHSSDSATGRRAEAAEMIGAHSTQRVAEPGP